MDFFRSPQWQRIHDAMQWKAENLQLFQCQSLIRFFW